MSDTMVQTEPMPISPEAQPIARYTGPSWEMPDATLVEVEPTQGDFTFEQASQRVVATLRPGSDQRLVDFMTSLSLGERAYIKGRFPFFDDDDQRFVLLAATRPGLG